MCAACALPSNSAFDGRVGQLLRVRAPGQFGQLWHERLYSIADLEPINREQAGFELLVRRCHVIDDFNGERYDGVASNHLCGLPPGGEIKFVGPFGHPFEIPEDRSAGLLMIGMGTGIAPFRGLVRRIYDELGGWEGPVRLFHGARCGLEMLYQNDENGDLGLYYDQPTFKAFKALSPRPHFASRRRSTEALLDASTEVWTMLTELAQYPALHRRPRKPAAAGGQPLAEAAGSLGALDGFARRS